MNFKRSIKLHRAFCGENPPVIRISVDKITVVQSEGPDLPKAVVIVDGASYCVEETYDQIMDKIWETERYEISGNF